MSSPRASLSVLMQVTLLAILAVVAAQAVIFAVVITAPPPQPAGFSIAAAAGALTGAEAQTTDGRNLRRRLSQGPGLPEATMAPLEMGIASGLARLLDRPRPAVRVRMASDGPPDEVIRSYRPGEAPMPVSGALATALERALGLQAGGAGDVSVQLVDTGNGRTRFVIRADRLTFPPFSASVQLVDGTWATVEPPTGWIDPWQARLLMALGITALLLAPLVWLLARRLTRPIRAFAQAAERLGANPDAEPLTPSGPSEVRTAIGAFNDMQAAIRGHMTRRTQTIAAIAHDLRTPLTRLRFRAEQAPEHLRDRMAADVEEMAALIGQAMAFVRGEVQPERRERLDLAALAAECAAGFAETGATVTFAGDTSLPVEGDPAALRRAVGNLIDNAVKFGGSAQVEAAGSAGRAVVTIRDTGPGLPDEELEAVFEPFHRGERSRSRQTGGAGLGLAVARRAARAAGGEVTLSNRPDGGLEARLSLPLA